MMARHLLVASMMVLGLVAVTSPANAVTIAFTVDVQINGGGAVTATAGGSILDITANVGDTLTFTIGLASAVASTVTTYDTTVTADDPTQMDYVAGSGAKAAGLGGSLNFAAFADPDNQLDDDVIGTGNDGIPGSGTINSAGPGAAIGVTDFYTLDYIVTSINADDLVDFAVSGIFATSGGDDFSAGGTAQVRINNTAPIPEPATLLLLGSGLAGLAGFGRRKSRRR